MSEYQIHIAGAPFNISSEHTQESIDEIESVLNSYIDKVPRQVVGYRERLVLAALMMTDDLLRAKQDTDSSNEINQIKSMCDLLAQACESTVRPTHL